MKALAPLERNLIISLVRSERGLNAFSVYTRFRCSPAELFNAAAGLARRGLVDIQENHIEMTKKGQEWIAENSKYLVAHGEKKWRQVPSKYLRPQLRSHDKYVPNTSGVHRGVLPSGWKSVIN